MAKKLSAIRAIVRQLLRDEFKSTSEQDWPDDELDLYIQQILAEISESRPYEVKETLTTTAGSKELDISSIEDFLELDPEHEIEYPVGSDPPNYHNASIFGTTLTMEIDFKPAASENVYLYCHKLHQLTESSSTLNPQIENALVLGVVALATITKARTHINKVNVGGRRVQADMQGWGMTKLALYQSAKRRLAKPKTNIQYPRS